MAKNDWYPFFLQCTEPILRKESFKVFTRTVCNRYSTSGHVLNIEVIAGVILSIANIVFNVTQKKAQGPIARGTCAALQGILPSRVNPATRNSSYTLECDSWRLSGPAVPGPGMFKRRCNLFCDLVTNFHQARLFVKPLLPGIVTPCGFTLARAKQSAFFPSTGSGVDGQRVLLFDFEVVPLIHIVAAPCPQEIAKYSQQFSLEYILITELRFT